MMKMPHISGSESKFGKTLDASPQDPQMSDQAKFHASMICRLLYRRPWFENASQHFIFCICLYCVKK